MSNAHVHVAGDLLVDHHLYDGIRRPGAASGVPTHLNLVPGGAGLLATILQHLATQDATGAPTGTPRSWSADLVLDGLSHDLAKFPLKSFGVWRVQPRKPGDEKEFIWRLSEPLGYGPTPALSSLSLRTDLDNRDPSVLVLDDGGKGFRKQTSQAAWPQVLTADLNGVPIATEQANASPWIVLKMSAPLARGDLWRTLHSRFRDRLIVVVAIDDIRKEEVLVTKAISWERAAADLAFELRCNPAIIDLLDCRHLVISLGSEGAFHVSRDRDGVSRFELFYDAQYLEGESGHGLDGTSVGFLSCLTCAIVRQYALLADDLDAANKGAASAVDEWEVENDKLRVAIRYGLAAMRRLHEVGHGNTKLPPPGFPLDEIGGVIRGAIVDPLVQFELADVPSPDATCQMQDSPWTIVTASQDRHNVPRIALYGLAARVARNGLRQFAGVPYLRFEKLFTVDRPEIESLRSLQRLVVDYLRSDREDKPLSLAVFGPPGAGKSFGVKQLAKAIYKREYRRDAPILEFNLSQFSDHDELIGAFHAIRDKVLEGVTPVVFWDEFDSGQFKWLQSLLAPMQDGKFNEGQITHPIGKCVFVFAGGTSYDFENFGPLSTDGPEKHDTFRLKKGPDFKSRLSGYLNVLGPNPRLILKHVDPAVVTPAGSPSTPEWRDDPHDICFPIRRALLIRSALGLKDDEKLDMDSGILSALLELGKYKHGARSLEKIVLQMKTHRDGNTVRRSALPPRELVSMHADYDELRTIANRDLQFRTLGIEMAPKIHEEFRRNKRAGLAAKAASEGKPPPPERDAFKLDVPFEELQGKLEWVREDNIAAATRISRILSMVGLRVVPENDPANDKPDLINRILADYLEFLAAEEHDGWMDHRLSNGWTMGPRDDDNRTNPNIVPFANLADEIKQYDRNAVSTYPQTVATAGFKIVRSGTTASDSAKSGTA